jgi:hypothetical protein
MGADDCGVASLGVNNGVGGGENTTAGIGVAIYSLGGCNGVDSGGRATGSTCRGVDESIADATRCI